MMTIAICAGFGLLSFGILGDWLTLRQESVLFAGLTFGYLFLFHRKPPFVPVHEKVRREQERQVEPDVVQEAAPVQRQSAPVTHRPAPVQAGGNLSFYQREAVVINQLLAQVYKLNCGIEFRNPKSIVPGYAYVNYILKQTGPLKFEALRAIEGNLAREINDLHRKYQFGDVQVIAMNSQPMVLQVTRAKPQRLMWSERKLPTKPMQVLLGHYYHGAHQHTLTIDLAGQDSDWINGAFFGQPGSGKSTILHSALINLLEVTPPEMLEVYAIDLKANTFQPYVKLPQVRQVASTIDGAIDILEKFERWCTAEGRPQDGKYRFLLMDETQMVVTHLEHGDYGARLLARILETGRQSNIRVLTATQNPDADSYPSKLKPKTHYMGAALVMNDDYLRRQMGIYGASKLQGKGEFIFVGPFGPLRLTTFWLTDEDRNQAIQGLVRKWGTGGATGGAGGAAPVRVGGSAGAQVVHDRCGGGAEAVRTTGAEGLPLEPGGDLLSVEFPIRPARPLTDVEVAAVQELATLERFFYRGELSLNRLVEYIYGPKRPERLLWVKQALGMEAIDDEQ